MCDCWFIRSEFLLHYFFFKAWFPKAELWSLPLGDRSVIAQRLSWSTLTPSRFCLLPTKLCVRRERVQSSRIWEFARASPSAGRRRTCSAPGLRVDGLSLNGAWRALLSLSMSELRCPGRWANPRRLGSRSPHGTAGPAASVTSLSARPSGTGRAGRKRTFHGFSRVRPLCRPGWEPGVSLSSRKEGAEPARSAAAGLLKWISRGRRMQSDLILNKTNRNTHRLRERTYAYKTGGWMGSLGLTRTHCSLLKINALRKVSIIKTWFLVVWGGFPDGTSGKEPATNAGNVRGGGSISGSGASLEEGMATHSQILAWRMPCTEEPGGLRSMRSQRGGHDWKATRNSSVPGSCFPCFPACLTETESYPRSPRRRGLALTARAPRHHRLYLAPRGQCASYMDFSLEFKFSVEVHLS